MSPTSPCPGGGRAHLRGARLPRHRGRGTDRVGDERLAGIAGAHVAGSPTMETGRTRLHHWASRYILRPSLVILELTGSICAGFHGVARAGVGRDELRVGDRVDGDDVEPGDGLHEGLPRLRPLLRGGLRGA